MRSQRATATRRRKVRSWRTASGVRAEVEKGVAKHASGARMMHAEALGRAEKNKSPCPEAVEHPCPSISMAIQFP